MLISKNKKAFHDYEILDKIEAGIVLTGPEVKSLRDKRVNLKGSFVSTWNGQAFVEGMHISPYKFAPDTRYDPHNKRKLLLHKKEILKLEATLNEKGSTAVPLEIYFKGSIIKLLIGICRGKKQYDKREELKKKAQNLDIARELKTGHRPVLRRAS